MGQVTNNLPYFLRMRCVAPIGRMTLIKQVNIYDKIILLQ